MALAIFLFVEAKPLAILVESYLGNSYVKFD